VDNERIEKPLSSLLQDDDSRIMDERKPGKSVWNQWSWTDATREEIRILASPLEEQETHPT
jgi:hypothetical protein